MALVRSYIVVAVLTAFGVLGNFSAQAQLDDLFKKATKSLFEPGAEDVGLGLKQALEFGVEEAVNTLSAEGGYLNGPYKILIPDEARTVINKLQYVPGFENVEQDLIDKMNQAAEYAAKEATPIFINAITNLTFDDAMKILGGDKDAATRYLEGNTREELYTAFMPVIQKALDEVNAREYWRSAVDAYNGIPFVRKVNPELDDYVNNKGLDGLFGEIEKKERGIRENQDQRTTELLRAVFAQQDQ